MKHLFLILLIAFALTACHSSKQRLSNYQSAILQVEQVSEKVFQHTSYLKTRGWGNVPCNGMVYINENEAIVFDTPTNDQASLELINWLGKAKIKAVVVSHFHIDCLGGLAAFHANDIASYATHQTIELATQNQSKVLPKMGFDRQMEFQIGQEKVYARYFGEGHTKDNIIAYIPSEKALFGGCLIKSLNAPKGNLADATVSKWAKTVEQLKAEISDIAVVIPGHGKNGGTELLDYTIDLFQTDKDKFVFFLHNRFLETHELEDLHPQFGRVAYQEILNEFKKSGLQVISEKRSGNVNARDYARGVVNQIDRLRSEGIPAHNITIIGTSKGGYIAQYVSTLANHPELNFVFIASFQNSDIQNIPEINYCGNILCIYEKSDPFGVSSIERKQRSNCTIKHYKEIELNTGMGHGFLFKPLEEWMAPTIEWALGNYKMD